MKNKSVKALCILFMAACVSLVLISSILGSNVLGRYVTNSDSDDGGRVAKMLFVGGSDSASITELPSYPGDEVTYEFYVSNQKDGAVAEVAISYSIAVEDYGNLPFEYSISCDGQDNLINGASLTDAGTFSGTAQFSAAQPERHAYKLTISWPAEENDFSLASEIEMVTISVKAEQLD